jgi:hypothetical protein
VTGSPSPAPAIQARRTSTPALRGTWIAEVAASADAASSSQAISGACSFCRVAAGLDDPQLLALGEVDPGFRREKLRR